MTPEASVTGPHEGYHLAQVNIGLAALPLDAPEMADFMGNLDRVNGLGRQAPGFVWLLTGDTGYGSTDVPWPGNADMLVNMSVWESVDALRAYAFTGEHVSFLRRRREFFKPLSETFAALWWIPAGSTPTVLEAHERIEHLKEHGPSAYAFTFQRPYAPE